MSTTSPTGHLLALENGGIGERYILGGDNLLLARNPAPYRRPGRSAAAVASNCPACRSILWRGWPRHGRRLFGGEPFLILDGLKMAKWRMWFSSAKAEQALGYCHRSAETALDDAVALVRATGYCS